MRKVILSMMVSLDGYVEGKDPECNWLNWDDEMTSYALSFFKTVDTFIYGRKSYEMMIAYWPQLNDEFADIMNQTPKLVFSRTLDSVTWNSTLIKTNAVAAIRHLKQQEGKDLVLFAGADLAETFIKNDLINEYRFIVNPVVLGSGKQLFKDISEMRQLKLKDTASFSCGNVLLIYEPIDQTS